MIEHENLMKAFEYSFERYQLLSNNEIDKKESIERYVQLSKKTISVVRKIFIEKYTDFNGIPLINESELVVSLNNDITAVDAYVEKNNNVVQVVISAGLILKVDSVSHTYLTNYNINTDDSHSDFLKNFSTQIKDTCYENINIAFSSHKNNFKNEINWSYLTSFSVLWILSHEIGHVLSGHLGYYYSSQGSLGISETNSKISLHSYNPYATSIDDRKIKWASELMADSYSVIRLYLISISELSNKQWYIDPEELINIITISSAIPALIFLIDFQLSDENPSSKDRYYPSEECRFFNILASTYICVFPEYNALVDMRRPPTMDYFSDNLIKGEYGESVVNVLKILLQIADNISVTAKLYGANMNLFLPLVAGGVLGAKKGLTAVYERDGKSYTDKYQTQWYETQTMLAQEYNMYFSHHLNDAWVTCAGKKYQPNDLRNDYSEHPVTKIMEVGSFANDPAYKAFDDWLSNIYSNRNISIDEKEFELKQNGEMGGYVYDLWKSNR
jgi:hypothetical protein